MTQARLKVAVTRKLPDPVEARMAELFDATFNFSDEPLSPAALIEAARGCDVLAPTLGDRLDAAFFDAAGDRLRLVANFGAGVDHIDVAAAGARGITVTNTPSVLAEDAADMAMALILAVPRRLVEGVKALEEGRFQGWSPTWMLGRRVRGKKLGIIGLGRVGQAIARRARAFGLSIHYHNRAPINPHVEEELEATYWESLDQMLARMDIVSVNCPHTPATYHLLSRRRLELLQPHAYVVNVSRGEIIDEAALSDMIADGRLAGAGLDVFEREPQPNPKLMAAPNVVLLPHMASATVESRIEMGERVIINIRMFADGHKPPDRVIPGLD
ncbi:2-hydroxyacid dehydrogenase [Amphiplicatus metriothermophilus]|uniref:Lactate dehydrogenase n=1 Tax=Amphiplicatus metriothermophilus TaxID=1519374 RepID=A0A239PLC3_9PROT|nr:D-glycerate dehydrogenase [Amphiplicatus metriothermophilus]MBB5517536.1 glyoxylate reductase [Amphiplicatus metriothermophilus]SNT68129.1 Lactate dehydrogenase [Amphiplicatus metriothermophilus]